MTALACLAVGFCLGALAGLRIAEAILAGLGQRITALEREIADERTGNVVETTP